MAGAIGSIAIFGAFLFLWRKDKTKQDQLDKLTSIAETWSKILELENKKHETMITESKMKIFPELRLTSHTSEDKNHEIEIANLGESAIVESIIPKPDFSAYIGNMTYPFILDIKMPVKIKFNRSGRTHIADITITISYADKAYNRYRCCLPMVL